MERAYARGQEGLPAEATIEAYRTIYFPAQEIHFAKDQPRAATTLIVHNDPRLAVRLESQNSNCVDDAGSILCRFASIKADKNGESRSKKT